MAAAMKEKTPLINEDLVTHFLNLNLPRGALMDTGQNQLGKTTGNCGKLCPLWREKQRRDRSTG